MTPNADATETTTMWLRLATLLRTIWPILALAGALVLPFFFESRYHIQILGFIAIYSLLAIGLNLIVGICDTFSLGHQAFYALGAYSSALLSTRLGVPFWIALPISALVAALFGLLIGPVMRLKGVFLAVATLAFGEIVRLVALNWDSLTNGPNGISGIPWPQIGPLTIDTPRSFYYLILVFLVLEYFVISRMINSRTGRAMKAMRDDDVAAQATGIYILHYKVLSFTVAALFAGIAGSLYAHFISFVSPDPFSVGAVIDMLFMIVLGGLGSVPGSIIGAAVVTVLPEILRPLADVREIVYAILIVFILIFTPTGIWGLIEQFSGWIFRRLPGSTVPREPVRAANDEAQTVSSERPVS